MAATGSDSRPLVVLVTGIGSCGPGEGIVKALKAANASGARYRIIGTDMVALSAMSYRVDGGYRVPRATDPGYFDRLDQICDSEQVDVLIPGTDVEMEVISHNLDRVMDTVFVMAHPARTVAVCRDSWKTHLYLAEHGFATPRSYTPQHGDGGAGMPFPRIIKDRFGGGSKNVFVVRDEAELDERLRHFERFGLEPIIQEYVGQVDEEYTTGVMVSREGEILSSVTFRRTLIAGASGLMVCDDFPEVRAEAERVAASFELCGSINIQCRLVDGVAYTFEINPRFSGSEPARVVMGVNEVDRAIQYYVLRRPLQRIVARRGVIMRCFQEVFASMDDLERLQDGQALRHAGQILDFI